MDAPPIKRPAPAAKVWDFAFGCLLVGGAPLATYWLLSLPSALLGGFVFQQYGERAAFRFQMVLLTIAFCAAFPAFIFAILRRKRHRLIPQALLPVEIIIAIVWAFFFMAFIGVLIGPNDDWN